MLRIIAIILNIFWIGFWIWLFLIEGEIEYMGAWDMVLAFLLLLAPITNLALIPIWGKDNWIVLYFKRRALEEKKKIAKIEEEIK